MSKSQTDDCKKIEIWWLLRDIKQSGYKSTTISWGENGSRGSVSVQVSIWGEEKYARFIYTQTDSSTGEKKDFDYKVPIIETQCHFGGKRHWFQCTLSKGDKYCGRRVGVLYKNGDWFGCRHCYELAYNSQNTNRRYKFYPMLRVVELGMQIEKLEKKTKRQTYRGKLTKKRQRLEALYAKSSLNYQDFQLTERGLYLGEKGRNRSPKKL